MNKTILIAGCDGMLGKAAAEVFSMRGWIVIGIDQKEKTEAKVNQYYAVDVKKEQDLDTVIREIEQESAIDALFNVAGYEVNKDFETVSYDEWNDLLNTILGGSANLCRSVAPKMAKRRNGSIILLSADYSKEFGDDVVNAVAASTLHGFGKSFGVEMASDNVLVNVLFANTPFDLNKVVETAYYLADKNTYATAQVVSISGINV